MDNEIKKGAKLNIVKMNLEGLYNSIYDHTINIEAAKIAKNEKEATELEDKLKKILKKRDYFRKLVKELTPKEKKK